MDQQLLLERYYMHYGKVDEISYSSCPYRICPLGAHVDHQHGLVTGFALNYGIWIAYSVNNDGLCQVVSHNFKERKRFNVKDIIERKYDWADYIRGVVKSLQKHGYVLSNGINAYIYGELPVGGLSSSAAVIIAFAKAIASANNIKLSNQEIVNFAYESETEFIGMSIGKLDQSCEVLSKKDKLLVLDTDTNEYKTVAKKDQSVKYEFLVIHCGAERLLASSAYNIRVDECKAAAFICKSYLGNYNNFKDSYLRDIPYEDFLKYQDKMPENFKKRALHFYSENERVKKGVVAWENGDIVEFGRLVNQSGKSSIELYEAGSPLLIDLYDIISTTEGVYGGRFMGGGFNGACLAIINPAKEKDIIDSIRLRYVSEHPEYADKVKFFICTSENGVGD
ncbi:MAG: GHMP kinase [Clostridia bacterium]|nr:GHMP kinase [Clostridia bacterium]